MNRKILKIITSLIICLILLNTVIPVAICAPSTPPTPDEMTDLVYGGVGEKLIKEVVDELKDEQINIDDLNEFIDAIRVDNNLINEGKPLVSDEEKYKQWVRETVIPEYKQYYKPFIESEGKNYTNTEEKKEAFKKYLENQNVNVDEVLGQSDAPYTELTDEEQARADAILQTEDRSWWEQIIDLPQNMLKTVTSGIINFVASLGDSVCNKRKWQNCSKPSSRPTSIINIL